MLTLCDRHDSNYSVEWSPEDANTTVDKVILINLSESTSDSAE